jgi:hypothetical protein
MHTLFLLLIANSALLLLVYTLSLSLCCSRRYIMLYEMITGELFQFPDPTVPAEQRIRSAVASFMEQRYQAAAAATSS